MTREETVILVKANIGALEKTCNDILRVLIGPIRLINNESETADMEIGLVANQEVSALGELTVSATIETMGKTVAEKVCEQVLNPEEAPNQLKRLAKLAVYRALVRNGLAHALPWGILTGIRPTKIVHRLFDAGLNDQDILAHLLQCYDMDAEKAKELVKVAQINRKFLLSAAEAGELVSLYVGIPFCPTRCAYCSFPAYDVKKNCQLLPDFMTALMAEIKATGAALRARGQTVQTVYVGGGTPTVLDEAALSELMSQLAEHVISASTVEITVEAGRPDTLDIGKLKLLKESGVTRLSINPQTMNRETLLKIGRLHTPEDIVTSYALAREVGFDNINMDLIIGLPGETRREVEATLRQLENLAPENITVHTMAVKRASTINEHREDYMLPDDVEVAAMLQLAGDFAAAWGMDPYYLYRQKYMVGPLENKGYARPHFECIYNIQVIEERQTILGLGAGAASKFVNPQDWTLTSFYNPKDPLNYCQRVSELVERKMSKLS